MLKSAKWTLPVFALSLMACGCQTKSAAVEGAGFSILTPSPETRNFIVQNDKPFAGQVAANNRACRRATACQKD